MKAILSISYILGHLAAGSVCVGLTVVAPLLSMLVIVIIGNDPGGPPFLPMFVVLLLVHGVALSALLSLLTLATDLLRARWRIPVWVPVVVIGFASVGALAWTSNLQAASWMYAVLGLGAAALFAGYWVAVSAVWFLPRILAQCFTAMESFRTRALPAPRR